MTRQELAFALGQEGGCWGALRAWSGLSQAARGCDPGGESPVPRKNAELAASPTNPGLRGQVGMGGAGRARAALVCACLQRPVPPQHPGLIPPEPEGRVLGQAARPLGAVPQLALGSCDVEAGAPLGPRPHLAGGVPGGFCPRCWQEGSGAPGGPCRSPHRRSLSPALRARRFCREHAPRCRRICTGLLCAGEPGAPPHLGDSHAPPPRSPTSAHHPVTHVPGHPLLQ